RRLRSRPPPRRPEVEARSARASCAGAGTSLCAMLCARGLDLETYAFAALQEADDLEEIVGARVARRPQHSHEAFGRDACGFSEVRKAKGRVDVIAQDGLRRGYVAGQHGFDSFAEKLFSEFGIALDASANGFLEITSQRHG